MINNLNQPIVQFAHPRFTWRNWKQFLGANRLVGILGVLLLLTSLLVVLILTKFNQPTPSTVQSLKVVVVQSPKQQLSLKEVRLEPILPSDYQLELLTDYYQIQQVDRNESVLWKGKIARKRFILPPLPQSDEALIPPFEIPLEEITLYLPYLSKAKEVLFLDEAGVLQLTVRLSDHRVSE